MRAIYLACYTPSAIQGIIGGSDRTAAVEKLVGAVGGKLISLDFTRGAYDVVVTVEVPDQATAVGLAGAVYASGSLSKVTLLEVLDMGPVLAAAKKGTEVYQGAG